MRRVSGPALESTPLGQALEFLSLTPIALLAVLLCPVPASVKWVYESFAVVVVFPLIISAGALDTPGKPHEIVISIAGQAVLSALYPALPFSNSAVQPLRACALSSRN